MKLRTLLKEMKKAIREADTWSAGSSGSNRGTGASAPSAPVRCPPGKVKNRETNRCVDLRGAARH